LGSRWRAGILKVLAGIVVIAAGLGSQGPASAEGAALTLRDCPSGLPEGTICHSGRSAKGAWFWVARPANWNGSLVIHAHGGPRLGQPERDEPVEDLQRFSMMVREGYAWAGSSYRRGGYGVRMAAEDTDDLRQIVWEAFGRPRFTLLHGQSWGANVAAKAAELYALEVDGARNYDGVILTSGVLAGGTRAYGFRADLRAVYQYYCRNHPRPEDVQYPLWQGLPAGGRMPRSEIERRVETCTGLGLPAAQRSQVQADNLRNILAVTGIHPAQLVAHLAWATNHFQDLVHNRLGGGNPFGNAQTRYAGSDDDVALNAGVERFTADPHALAMLAYDADLSGLIVLPTVTIHGISDPTASVGMAALYQDTVAAQGRGDLLFQTFVREAEHSRLSAPQYLALLASLMNWIETGERPTLGAVVQRCDVLASAYGEPCLFDPDFHPDASRD